jgi:hypothetical protein
MSLGLEAEIAGPFFVVALISTAPRPLSAFGGGEPPRFQSVLEALVVSDPAPPVFPFKHDL